MTLDLRQQPGGHPPGDEVYSSGDFIAFTERMRNGFDWRPTLESKLAPAPVIVGKRRALPKKARK